MFTSVTNYLRNFAHTCQVVLFTVFALIMPSWCCDLFVCSRLSQLTFTSLFMICHAVVITVLPTSVTHFQFIILPVSVMQLFSALFSCVCHTSCTSLCKSITRLPPKGGQGCLMSPPCLKSQGCHLIPLYYPLTCSSA